MTIPFYIVPVHGELGEGKMIVYSQYRYDAPRNGMPICMTDFKEHKYALWIFKDKRLCLSTNHKYCIHSKDGILTLQKGRLTTRRTRAKIQDFKIIINKKYVCVCGDKMVRPVIKPSRPTSWAFVLENDISNYQRNDLVVSYETANTSFDKNHVQLAFSGAEGFGAYSKGGRGGKLYWVTVFEDDDNYTGTLRHAVEYGERPLNIFFSKMALIKLNKPLVISKGNVTIDGSVTYKNEENYSGITGYGIIIDGYAENIAIRYINIHTTYGHGKALSIYNSHDIIVDHCSLSSHDGEIIQLNSYPPSGPKVRSERDTDLITIQNCLIYGTGHANNEHIYSNTFSGSDNGRISVIRNLFIHCGNGIPRFGHSLNGAGVSPMYTDFRNNLVYNWASIPGCNCDEHDNPSRFNFVNNVYVPGPNTTGKTSCIFMEFGSTKSKGYFSGNIFGDNLKDNLIEFDGDIWTEFQIENYQETLPINTVNTTTIAGEFIREYLLENCGAIIPQRNETDKKVINSFIYCTRNPVEN